MASQIKQLRSHFNGLNNTQKKQFIDNLKQKLQGSKNAEYMAFLNDCIKNYNEEVKKINKNVLASTPKTVQASQTSRVVSTPKKSSNTIDDIAKKATGIVGNIKEEFETSETVGKIKDDLKQGKNTKKILVVVCLIIAVIGGGVFASSFLGGGSVKNQIVGKWANTESGIAGVLYIFSSDGTYAYSLVGNKDLFSNTTTGKAGVVSEEIGTYKVSGKTITLYPKTDKTKTIKLLNVEDNGDTIYLGTSMEKGNFTRLKRQR